MFQLEMMCFCSEKYDAISSLGNTGAGFAGVGPGAGACGVGVDSICFCVVGKIFFHMGIAGRIILLNTHSTHTHTPCPSETLQNSFKCKISMRWLDCVSVSRTCFQRRGLKTYLLSLGNHTGTCYCVLYASPLLLLLLLFSPRLIIHLPLHAILWKLILLIFVKDSVPTSTTSCSCAFSYSPSRPLPPLPPHPPRSHLNLHDPLKLQISSNTFDWYRFHRIWWLAR